MMAKMTTKRSLTWMTFSSKVVLMSMMKLKVQQQSSNKRKKPRKKRRLNSTQTQMKGCADG